MHEMQIDWPALHSAFQMNMPEVRCFLDLTNGRVLKLPPGDPSLPAVLSEPQTNLPIGPIPSREQYQWLDEFIKSIEDVDIRDRMEAAINGKGAFRRFKDILLTLPDERRRWFEYRDKMMQMYTAEFLRQSNIVATNEAPWGPITLPEAPISHLSPVPGGMAPLGMSGAHHPSGPSLPGMNVMPKEGGSPGNVQPAAATRAPPAATEKHEIEALRDFIIEYADSRTPEAMVNPLQLEELASQIAKRFSVRSLYP